MKNLLLLVLGVSLCTAVQAQNFFLEVNSGFGYTAHDIEEYSQAGFVPIAVRVGGGLDWLQAGLEFRPGDMVPPTYIFQDAFTEENRLKEESKNSYFGGFVRLKMGSFFVKAGAGKLESQEVLYTYEGPQDDRVEQEYSTRTFTTDLALTGEAGFAIGLGGPLYLNVSYQYFYAKKQLSEQDALIRDFGDHAHLGLIGFGIGF